MVLHYLFLLLLLRAWYVINPLGPDYLRECVLPCVYAHTHTCTMHVTDPPVKYCLKGHPTWKWCWSPQEGAAFYLATAGDLRAPVWKVGLSGTVCWDGVGNRNNPPPPPPKRLANEGRCFLLFCLLQKTFGKQRETLRVFLFFWSLWLCLVDLNYCKKWRVYG